MLFHSVQGGAPGVDVEQVICELSEDIDAAHFERAWQAVIDRHTSLRTSFEWPAGGAPRQIVQPASRTRLRFRHEEFGSEHEARNGVEAYLASDRREGFASLEAPLVRVALFRGGSRRHWFVTTYHHLALDARSMAIMFREALDFHDAFVAGKPLSLPTPKPFRHYIDWLQTVDTERAEKFWRQHLKGFTSAIALPLAAPSAAVGEDVRGELLFRLPADATAKLRELARAQDVTLNTALQAAWAVVLSRYTGEEDIVFGAVRACRHIPVDGVGSIVGLFINTVPVRVAVAPEARIGEWLQQLRETWIAMRDHEHTPLMKVQQWSDVAPGQPLFDTLFNFQEPSWDASLRMLGGKWEQREWDIRGQPNYPIAIDASGGANVLVRMVYDRRRFADDAVSRLAGHFRVVLEALAAGTCETVGELPVLTSHERKQILIDWNRTARDFPRTRCVHHFVEGHASAAPTRIAVADASAVLTFEELNARANQVARRLQRHGVTLESRVAVCMDRSVEMIVAWLGILKAGAAFVPLDPAYPRERLAFQLGDCQAAAVITQARLRSVLPPLPATVPVIELTADGAACADEAATNLDVGVAAENLAYVIYTSGSTGQPKGVQIEHRALMNLVTWHEQVYALTPADRGSHLASPAFDASVWEIWPYLAAGASVHIPDEETRISPAQLWRWLAAQRVTVAFIPTPLAELTIHEPWPEDMVLRALLTGGDKLKRRPPATLRCELINHYGPTENTVVATCSLVRRGNESAAPAIGGPIANTQVYVLDPHRRPVPVGVAGELYIGGESLARGYLGRPDLNAEKFVSVPGLANRLYRTGDLVRWTPTGELEFIARLDGQVKIRGCRIELGEIEATLHAHPAVRESLVLARPDAMGQNQLVAYVVAQPDAAPATEATLLEFIRSRLPAYMVPAAVVFVDAWPLTPNGKIDRHALPAPDLANAARGADFAAPRTATEKFVAKVWSDILGRTPVGLNDNFFELGGHSLLAAQVMSRINATMPAPVSVRILFDHPVVAALARELDARRDIAVSAPSPLQRLKRRTSRTEMELVRPTV